MYASEAESFLERPAVDIAPTGPSGLCETTLVGRTVSHYQVLSLPALAVWARFIWHETRDWIELSR